MEKEDILQVGFDQIKNLHEIDYMDGNIAFHKDIRELPTENGTIRMNMYAMVPCSKGRLQVELDTETFTIGSNDLLICSPNTLITNCMLTPDFDGAIMCISQRVISESFSQSNMWERAFRFSKNPILHFGNEDNLKLIKLYGELLIEKAKSKQTQYKKEIINSLVKAVIYEVLANAETSAPTNINITSKQRDVLFKRFINLITDMAVKPRSVAWYADRLCVTPKHLSAVCKQVSGRTALDWISEYALIDIRYYLKNSEKSIKEIADLLDFPNISFFGKYCRQHFGMSPKEYRRQLREEPVSN